MTVRKIFATLLLSSLALASVCAQSRKNNTLFTAGHASAFIGGLYDAYFPYKKLLEHGNFGLGAPDKLDGELMILDGKIYQTQVSGKTFELKPAGLVPFAVVNFFKADQTIRLSQAMTKDQLYNYLDKLLPNKNGIYAIRIKGHFAMARTRAFPPVTEKPYKPLAAMLDLQRFFTFERQDGDLVGYRIPAYMDGPNITGYHFHYISADKKSGGHIIDLLTGDITIEIDVLDSFTVDIPQTEDFKNFDLSKDRKEEVKQVENGKKG